jgi:hypothetical protein
MVFSPPAPHLKIDLGLTNDVLSLAYIYDS